MICPRCNQRDGRHPQDSYCQQCRRDYQRAWAANNRDRVRGYVQDNRARLKSGEHTRRAWEPGSPGRPPRDAP